MRHSRWRPSHAARQRFPLELRKALTSTVIHSRKFSRARAESRCKAVMPDCTLVSLPMAPLVSDGRAGECIRLNRLRHARRVLELVADLAVIRGADT
jgi:hypothetical protein